MRRDPSISSLNRSIEQTTSPKRTTVSAFAKNLIKNSHNESAEFIPYNEKLNKDVPRIHGSVAELYKDVQKKI